MRVDKFLKVSRIVKRRPVAKSMGDKGRIEINGTVAKAGSPVAVGDTVTVHFGNRRITVRVQELKETTKKAGAENMYDIIAEEKIEN